MNGQCCAIRLRPNLRVQAERPITLKLKLTQTPKFPAYFYASQKIKASYGK
jgi:hypothetical protein